MLSSDYIISWSIRLSLTCLFVLLSARILARGTTINTHVEKIASLLGFAFAIIHFWAAFEFHHHWSHLAAFKETAERTERLFGVSLGYGVYFNYAFLIAWLSDLVLLLTNRYSLREFQTARWSLRSYLLFIAINGAIVFVSGPVRWISLFALALLSICYFACRNKKASPTRE